MNERIARPRWRLHSAAVLGASSLFIAVHAAAQSGDATSKTTPGSTPAPDAAAAPVTETTSAGPAKSSSEIDTARVHFQRGVEFFGEESYEAALVEFQRAYEIAPSFQILYNTGRIHNALKNYARALKDLRQYLAEGGGSIADDRRKQVFELIRTLEQKVATLQIVSKVEGTVISVDDHPVGTVPIQGLFVNPGDRRVTASKQGYLPVTVVVTVTSTESRRVELNPTRLAESKVVVQRARIAPVIAWATTGVLAAGAVATGLVALNAEKDLNNRKDSEIGKNPGAFDDDADKVRNWAIATDALAAGALIAGGLSIYLTFFDTDPAESGRTPSARVGLSVAPKNLAIHGSF